MSKPSADASDASDSEQFHALSGQAIRAWARLEHSLWMIAARMTATQDSNGTATLTYDLAGHMTGDGVNTFTYNDRGRMTSVTTAGGVVSYVYNGQNQRAGKSGATALVPTGAAYFVYDEAGQLLGEYDGNGVPVYETI
jgi:YD repeat-containing protein